MEDFFSVVVASSYNCDLRSRQRRRLNHRTLLILFYIYKYLLSSCTHIGRWRSALMSYCEEIFARVKEGVRARLCHSHLRI